VLAGGTYKLSWFYTTRRGGQTGRAVTGSSWDTRRHFEMSGLRVVVLEEKLRIWRVRAWCN
jgi:hypothetical protein